MTARAFMEAVLGPETAALNRAAMRANCMAAVREGNGCGYPESLVSECRVILKLHRVVVGRLG